MSILILLLLNIATVMSQNFYEILEINREASEAEIKR